MCAAPTMYTTTTTLAPVGVRAQDRAAAAGILTVCVQHYRDELYQGQAIIGHTQYADASAGLVAMDEPNSAAAGFRDLPPVPEPGAGLEL
ncbi:hypothetical protein JJ691_23270 [Kutzneria sp. CA-103260]|nr:hypothetical protein JJ691_23270 [Kutzneria sp. CA-103260]